MYFFSNDKKCVRGFTIIEILVAITVMAILVSITYAHFGSARSEARDRARMNQLEQLRVALELYKDQHGRYPAAGCNGNSATTTLWVGPAPEGGAAWDVPCDDYIFGSSTAPFVPDFMEELPKDPSGNNTALTGYYYRTTGTDYKVLVLATVERVFVGETDTGNPYKRYASGCAEGIDRSTYAIYSAGARCW